ncbi:hypothetical protein [Paracoccus aerodenitrificans]|uniref:hypothetical protein n=1 Tax=Paracoccus aerodenitrificans TaxID=3017781 RepID=UPI0022F08287|nr:hypothetical protein [Paracoccus aerodenitrificans]WBU63470.1 hypothetical protein PAE61_14065 [Paracoccus aerodenitrificans]
MNVVVAGFYRSGLSCFTSCEESILVALSISSEDFPARTGKDSADSILTAFSCDMQAENCGGTL